MPSAAHYAAPSASTSFRHSHCHVPPLAAQDSLAGPSTPAPRLCRRCSVAADNLPLRRPTVSGCHLAALRFPSAPRLVALSRVPKTPDPYQNALLMLPTDALSVLKVRSDVCCVGA